MKTFVELGACDFETLTPLLMSGWRGYFIEPIPRYMQLLQLEIQKQKLNNAIFEQSAITNYDGEIEMVFVSRPDEQWKRGISHIKLKDGQVPQNYTSNLIQHNGFNSETINVNALTLNSFLIKHEIEEIDLMKIDVEGHELIILESYDWIIKPKFLKIEHKFVNNLRLINLLNKQGYFVWEEQYDLYAFLK